MRELVFLLVFAGACAWMTGYHPAVAVVEAHAVRHARGGNDLGVTLAEVLGGGLARRFAFEKRGKRGRLGVWSAMADEFVSTITAAGREDAIQLVRLTLWLPRGGVFGKPDRSQIAVSKALASTLLRNVTKGRGTIWVDERIERYVSQGEAAPAERDFGRYRLRISFEPAVDGVVLLVGSGPS